MGGEVDAAGDETTGEAGSDPIDDERYVFFAAGEKGEVEGGGQRRRRSKSSSCLGGETRGAEQMGVRGGAVCSVWSSDTTGGNRD